MSKKAKATAPPKEKTSSAPLSSEFVQEVKLMLNNGLGDVLGIGRAGEVNDQFFSQLSQLDTMFKNLRWGLVSNQRQLLSQMYVEHGLVQTVIDVPVDDALRGGVLIETKQLDEQQIKELIEHMDSEGDINEYATAQKWKRLYGGAAFIVLTDQDPSTPLSTKELNEDSPMEFKAIDMWELNNPEFFEEDERQTQLKDDEAAEVSDKESSVPIDRLRLTTTYGCFQYYGQSIHKSRIRIMKGLTPPSFLRPRLRGWGFSEIEHLVSSINQFLKTNNLTFEVLDEFKLDIFKIKGLANSMLSKVGQQSIMDRVAMANTQKNYQNALTMDKEDDYDHKQLSFTGLAEVMTGIRINVALDMRMPLTKIFGMSAAGFNSGEDDIENYNSMVDSRIRSKSKPDLLWLVKLRCKQLYGFIPTDLCISFLPLRVLSAEGEETVKDKKFGRLIQAQQAGLCTVKEFKDGCNKENLLPIKLDSSIDKLDETGNEHGDESQTEIEDRRNEEGFNQQSALQDKANEANKNDDNKDKLKNSLHKKKAIRRKVQA